MIAPPHPSPSTGLQSPPPSLSLLPKGGMPRTPSTLLLLTISIGLSDSGARAQTNPPASATPASSIGPSDATPPIFRTADAGKAAPATALTAGSGRDLSPVQSAELTSALASGLPKYEPPQTAAQAAAAAAAVRDTDIPRNHIIRLPRFLVKDGSTPEYRLKVPLTPKERADLAMKQYVIDTKDMPPFAAGIARALFLSYASQEYADAERAREMAVLDYDEREAAISGDSTVSESIKKESADLFMRHEDWAAPIPTNRAERLDPTLADWLESRWGRI